MSSTNCDEAQKPSNHSTTISPTLSDHEDEVNQSTSFPGLSIRTSSERNDSNMTSHDQQQQQLQQGSTTLPTITSSSNPAAISDSTKRKPPHQNHGSDIIGEGQCNDEDAQVGSLSPTSSSSYSSQGSTSVARTTATKSATLKPIHGFSSSDNLLAHATSQSNLSLASEPGATLKPTHGFFSSNDNLLAHATSQSNLSLASEPGPEQPKQQQQHPNAIAKSDTKSNYIQGTDCHHVEKKKKLSSSPSPSQNADAFKESTSFPTPTKNSNKNRSRFPTTTTGRPRSNSVPFDFGSENASSPSSSNNKQLRRGKWTAEEESYVARVIQDFNSGYLNAPPGTTLRTYLSDKLNCDPMRITKKFTGDACIGKRVFHPAVRCSSNAGLIDKAQVGVI